MYRMWELQMKKNVLSFSFWDWLNSVNMIISNCIHFTANNIIFLFCMAEKKSHCRCGYPFLCLWILRLVAQVNSCEHFCRKHWYVSGMWSADLDSLVWIPRRGRTGSQSWWCVKPFKSSLCWPCVLECVAFHQTEHCWLARDNIIKANWFPLSAAISF